jgi:3-hydroxyisobutyrate dehydrogenase
MPDAFTPTVGFVGLGIMGGAMTLNLRKAGYHVVVNDVRREVAERQTAQGAEWADTAADVAARVDVVFTCLPSLPIIEKVALGADGLIAGIRPGTPFFEMSTNSLALLKKLHVAFQAKGCEVLDAPVSGGALGAVRGQMGIWVGGDRASFDRFEPVLRAMGDMPTHVGAIGSGLVTKLVHNCASQTTQAAIAESFVLGVKAGADPLSLWAAIRQGSIGRRRTFDGLVDEFLPAEFDPPHAALRIVEKDMMLVTELGRELKVPMPFASLTLAGIHEAIQRGWSDRDSRTVMLLPQERAGVRIKVPKERIEDVLRKDPPAPSDTKRGKGV